MFYNAGLIFEGGGMRGAYTAGIIDALLENDIEFAYCYGVSSGACHATTYLSKQIGRANRVVSDYLEDKRYFSLRNLITTGNMFGIDMMFNIIPKQLDPYDYEGARKNPAKFYVGVINVKTAESEYLHVADIDREYMKIAASMSLPIISRKVKIDGQSYLDGGIVDSIPLKRSIADGNKKTVLVLTQDAAYRKGINKILPIIALCYCFYPKFVWKIATRHIRYNQALELVAAEEQAGRAFVFRPKKPVKVGRLELNREKIDALYKEGYEDGIEMIPKLKAFLEAP